MNYEQRKKIAIAFENTNPEAEKQVILPRRQSYRSKIPNWQVGVGTTTTENHIEIRSGGPNQFQELQ